MRVSRSKPAAGLPVNRILQGDCVAHLKSLPTASIGLVFADPPYEMDGLDRFPALVLGSGILAPGGLFVMEHSDRYDFSSVPHFLESRNYGRVHFTFFRVE